jgi:hypothetical protein
MGKKTRFMTSFRIENLGWYFTTAKPHIVCSDRDILTQLVAYKTTKGDFVKQRTRRMVKEYEKQGIYPIQQVNPV